jgi:hypothetical protein
MNKSTISTFELFAMFPDEASARTYLERRRWPDGPRCPVCGLGDRITPRKDASYRCNQCKEDFTVRTGVAVSSRSGTGLWHIMHRDRPPALPPLQTAPEKPPSAPWCAARMEVGALFMSPDTLMALGDFGRALAWAWITRWERAS